MFTGAYPAYLIFRVILQSVIPRSFLFHSFLFSPYPLQEHASTLFDAEKIGFSLLEPSTYKLRNNLIPFLFTNSLLLPLALSHFS